MISSYEGLGHLANSLIISIAYQANIDLFGPDQGLELLRIIQISQLRDLLHEVVQKSLPVEDNRLVIFLQSILIRDRRDETPWPSLFHSLTKRVKLVESPVDLNRTISVLSLDQIHGVFG
jgi:hypothetical protein